jgi:drug/metabolite transporter (DMT)-like permease
MWSRPFIEHSSPLAFLTSGMLVGALLLVIIAAARGGFAPLAAFNAGQWLGIVYLGIGGAALNFYLWVLALERTTPTRVANTITVNPIAASIVAALAIGEPIGLHLVAGVAAVALGIWIASTETKAKLTNSRCTATAPSPVTEHQETVRRETSLRRGPKQYCCRLWLSTSTGK